MKLAEFITKLHTAYKSRNIYVNGGFGVNLSNKNQLERHLTLNEYNRQNADKIRKAAEQHPPVYGFDCIGLIKGILWGWCDDPNGTYGGAIYCSNGLEDCTIYNFTSHCCGTNYRLNSLTYSQLKVGQILFTDDHVAVYIGHGLTVESTRYGDGVIRIARVLDYIDEDDKWNDFIVKYPSRSYEYVANILPTWLEYSSLNEDKVVMLFAEELPKALMCYKIFDASGEVVYCAEGEIDIMVQNRIIKPPFTVVEVPVDIVPWG